MTIASGECSRTKLHRERIKTDWVGLLGHLGEADWWLRWLMRVAVGTNRLGHEAKLARFKAWSGCSQFQDIFRFNKIFF